MRINLRVIVVMAALTLNVIGCASILNPYNKEFQCPDTYKGKCVSMQQAYEESLNGGPKNATESTGNPDADGGASNPFIHTTSGNRPDPRREYEALMYHKLAGVIAADAPETPLLIPPKPVRVLILSYTDGNNIMMGHRHAYFLATEPRWVLSTFEEAGK